MSHTVPSRSRPFHRLLRHLDVDAALLGHGLDFRPGVPPPSTQTFLSVGQCCAARGNPAGVASLSCTFAVVIHETSSSLRVSTNKWRFLPFIFFPASYPLVSASCIVFTLWLSRIPAVGSSSCPSFLRTLRRSSSLSFLHVPSLLHFVKKW